MKKGRRISIWIPEEDEWMLRALEGLQQAFEEEGISMSRGEVIRYILAPELRKANEKTQENHSM